MGFFTVFITLFLIIDAIGNLSSFVEILKGKSTKEWIRTLLIEMGIALLVMLFFDFVGDWLLDFLGVSEIAVWITSGIILFLFALSVLYPGEKSPRISSKRHEIPFIVPLAIPLVAGPALLATIVLFAHIYPDPLMRIEAIFLAWLLSAVLLLSGRFIHRIIGANGLLALERLFALILVIMAVQRVMQGIKEFVLFYN